MLACAAAQFLRIISGVPPVSARAFTPLSFAAQAIGGARTYTYSLSGVWPAGLTINSSGIVSGLPTEDGAFTDLSVRVTDGMGRTAELSPFDLFVDPVARLTQQYAEIINAEPASARLRQQYIEVVNVPPSPGAQLTQQYLELINIAPGVARLTQQYVEIITP